METSSFVRSAVGVLFGVALAAGCSSSSGGSTASNDAGLDAGSDAAATSPDGAWIVRYGNINCSGGAEPTQICALTTITNGTFDVHLRWANSYSGHNCVGCCGDCPTTPSLGDMDVSGTISGNTLSGTYGGATFGGPFDPATGHSFVISTGALSFVRYTAADGGGYACTGNQWSGMMVVTGGC